jgi:AhpD family alkylhydroperoxidase
MSESRDQNRIQPIDPDHAIGAISRLFAEIRAKFALVPHLFRVLANAPAALEGLMDLSAALARGALDEKTREQLALAIAESNLCAYCLNVHTALAAKIGLNHAEIDDAIRSSAADARTDAILKLARCIVVQRGELSDADLGRARRRLERWRNHRDGRQRRIEYLRELREPRRAGPDRLSAKPISRDVRSGRHIKWLTSRNMTT